MRVQQQSTQDDPYAAAIDTPTRDTGAHLAVVPAGTGQAGQLWPWLTEGQNGVVLAAGLSLIVSVVTVAVLLWTLRAVLQQTRAAEAQAAAARSQARLAELQIREMSRGSRLAKRRRRTDEAVWTALDSARDWAAPGGRRMTGAGAVAVRAAEIAEHLQLSEKAVSVSLWRLEARGRAMDQGGTMADSRHLWTAVAR